MAETPRADALAGRDGRAGIVADRRLGVGDVLDGAVKLVFRYPLPAVGTPVAVCLLGVGVVVATLFVIGGFRFLPVHGSSAAVGVGAVWGLYWLVAGSFDLRYRLLETEHAT